MVPDAVLGRIDGFRLGQSVPVDRRDIEQPVAAPVASASDRLTEDHRRWFHEFIGVSECGLALGMLADWLSEENRPITESEGAGANVLAEAMGTVDRVMGPLALCPQT